MAVEAEVDVVRAVARVAGERFRQIDDERIARCADDAPPTAEDLLVLAENGSLLVAEEDGEVVGFVAMAVVDGRAHVEEVSVDPAAQGRGHGSVLLAAAARWSEERGLDGVSLTTFRDVPWNRPYYERRGFTVLHGPEITPELRDCMAHEAELGLEPELRVAMWRPPA